MTALIIIAVLYVAGMIWLVYELITAPYGKEIPFVGWVKTDKYGNPVERKR